MLPEWENVEVVSSDNLSIGQVSGVVWKDGAGFHVVEVGGAVVPLRAEEPADKVVVEFTAAELQSGPLLNELAARGGDAAVEMIRDYYNVPLSGPPPGPSPQPLPPWWEKKYYITGEDSTLT